MTPERWSRIKDVFTAALELPVTQRSAFLESACNGEADLRAEVERLLADSGDTSFPSPVAGWPRVNAYAAGDTIAQYRIEDKLGEGGMGVVYRAKDTRLGRSAALKLVKTQLRRRWDSEARAVAALNHPHIATLYEAGEHQGTLFLAMELVDGKPLKGPLPVKQVVAYATQVADALSAAHAAGVVHRDLKPANILVTEEGSVKILDFGLAKLTAESDAASTQTAVLAGTPGYLAPEQIEGKPADTRIDIFAFGCILYELASGQRAFAGDSVTATLAATAAAEPKPLEGVPAALERLIRWCLRKNPNDRLQHIGDAKILLEQVTYETGQRPQFEIPPISPRKRTARLIAVAAFGAVAVLAALAIRAVIATNNAVNLADYSSTPFAASLPIQADPAWSPDGKTIAFLDGPEIEQANLFAQTLGAPNPVRLTNSPFTVLAWFQPFWSPDSRFIYFTVWYARPRYADGIWRISAAGGEPALVQEGAAAGAVSPDGRTLVMLAATDAGRRSKNLGMGGPTTIWIATPPEAKPRPYEPTPFVMTNWTGRVHMAFAPDGRKILVACTLGNRDHQFWLLPWPPGNARRVLQTSGLGTLRFAWLRDSRHIVAGVGTRMVVADVEGGDVSPVLTESRTVAAVSASPDGGRLAYQSSLSHTDVIAVPLASGPAATVLGNFRNEQMAQCSPVAQQVVYVTDQRGENELWIASLAEGWRRPVAITAKNPRMPVFSPDGRRIAFDADTGTSRKIFVTFIDNPAPVRATAAPDREMEFDPSWSPDGNSLSYRSSGLRTVRLGSQEPPARVHDVSIQAPEWSPTGEWIAALTARGIVLVSPDGSRARTIQSEALAQGRAGPLAWSRDGKTIYQVRGQSFRAVQDDNGANHADLVAIDVASGDQRVIRDLGDLAPYPNNGARLSLMSDGKSLVYTVLRPREEIWILEGFQLPRPWYMRMRPW